MLTGFDQVNSIGYRHSLRILSIANVESFVAPVRVTQQDGASVEELVTAHTIRFKCPTIECPPVAKKSIQSHPTGISTLTVVLKSRPYVGEGKPSARH